MHIRYTERLAEAGIEPSVGDRGDCYGNALAETINSLDKAELIHRRAPWKTKEAEMRSRCRVPCDYLPRRSWPLFKARAVLRGLLASNDLESTS